MDLNSIAYWGMDLNKEMGQVHENNKGNRKYDLWQTIREEAMEKRGTQKQENKNCMEKETWKKQNKKTNQLKNFK